MERAEWTDRRIGDQFRLLWERVGALDRANERLAVIEGDLRRLLESDFASSGDVHECQEGIRALSEAFAKRAEAREVERKAHAAERKADRRFQFFAATTCATLVIGALALLLPILLGPT